MAKTLGARVFIPDFFGEGNTFDIGKFPPSSEQDKKDLQEFFGTIAQAGPIAARLVDFANLLKSEGFKKIGAVGYCFGNVCTTIRRWNRGY